MALPPGVHQSPGGFFWLQANPPAELRSTNIRGQVSARIPGTEDFVLVRNDRYIAPPPPGPRRYPTPGVHGIPEGAWYVSAVQKGRKTFLDDVLHALSSPVVNVIGAMVGFLTAPAATAASSSAASVSEAPPVLDLIEYDYWNSFNLDALPAGVDWDAFSSAWEDSLAQSTAQNAALPGGGTLDALLEGAKDIAKRVIGHEIFQRNAPSLRDAATPRNAPVAAGYGGAAVIPGAPAPGLSSQARALLGLGAVVVVALVVMRMSKA